MVKGLKMPTLHSNGNAAMERKQKKLISELQKQVNEFNKRVPTAIEGTVQVFGKHLKMNLMKILPVLSGALKAGVYVSISGKTGFKVGSLATNPKGYPYFTAQDWGFRAHPIHKSMIYGNPSNAKGFVTVKKNYNKYSYYTLPAIQMSIPIWERVIAEAVETTSRRVFHEIHL